MLIALLALGPLACGGEDEPHPLATSTATCEESDELPAPDDGFLLGLAGVPRGSFGPSDAPDFAAAFAALVEDGFNRFVPVFLTSEAGASTSEATFFLPAELTGATISASCAGPSNPWLAAPEGMGLVLPGYLLVPEVPVAAPLDAALVTERMTAFVATCLAGDAARVADVYLYDEPANNYSASLDDADPTNDFRLENVAALASGARAAVEAPTLLVEAPMPLLFDYLELPADLEAARAADWQLGVAATAPVADLYGYDFYAVDLTDDFSPTGRIVDDARAAAPQAAPIAVVQGFGYADMGIDMPPATGRRPRSDEVRANAFVAVARGARGVFWYGQSALALDDPEPGLWEAMRATARDLRRVSGALALPALELDVGNAGVVARAHGEAGDVWVLLVNPTPVPQAIHLPGAGRVRDALSGAYVADGAVDRQLAPYEALALHRSACLERE